MAEKAKFKSNDPRFNVRDNIRLESIFKDNQKRYVSVSRGEGKDNNINSLLNKKHKLDRGLQIALESAGKNARRNVDFNFNTPSFSSTLSLKTNITIRKKAN